MPTGTVLVTGASTGIGEATVLHLRELGFDPIARRAQGRGRRAAGGTGAAHRAHRRDRRRIRSPPRATRSATSRSPGLVNNAGIAVAAPLEFLPIDRLRQQLEINLIGQAAVTQAFLPALRRARGRIVNVSSIGGRVALPLVGAYNASKFGLEGLSDSLRRELRSQGVDVILIEPGGVKTPIWKKGEELADEMLEDVPPEAERLYGRLIAERARGDEEDRRRSAASSRARWPRRSARRSPRAGRAPATWWAATRSMRAVMAKLLPARVMDRLIGRALGG